MNVLTSKVLGAVLFFAMTYNVYVIIVNDFHPLISEREETFVRNVKLLSVKSKQHYRGGGGGSGNGGDGGNEGRKRYGIVDMEATSMRKNQDSFISSSENIEGHLNVYYYEDICADNDNFALLWNNLFPNYPGRAKLFTIFEDEKLLLSGQSRRFLGFIVPKKTDLYRFRLVARLGAEMILIEDSTFLKDKVYDKFLLRFAINKSKILNEIDPKLPEKPFVAESHAVKLKAGKKYLVDITHVVPMYGFLKLKWRAEMEEQFKTIPASEIFSVYAQPDVNKPLPNIKYITDISPNTKHLHEDAKNSRNIPVLAHSSKLKQCNYKPDYLSDKIEPGFGTWYIKIDKLFPRDRLILDHNPDAKPYELFMKKQTAVDIAGRFVKENIDQSYTLNRIVHIEENQEMKQGKRYFIEVDVIKDGDSTKLYRSSGWIFLNNTSSELCRPMGFEWKEDEKIYLITPVKNQARWIRYLIHSLNEVIERTSEKSLHLIMVDFSSTDCKVEDLLKKCNFPFTLLKEQGAFSKVIGLNKGVNSINEEEGLVFVLDLQLQIPDFIFDDIRKHTFKRRTTYVPILCRLQCGEHPLYTNLTKSSIWQEIGYGMISIFKSDWLRIGGMDEKKFGQKWGGEDWDFVERVLVHKMEVIHHRIPGYYHIYHSTKGTWDGTKEF